MINLFLSSYFYFTFYSYLPKLLLQFLVFHDLRYYSTFFVIITIYEDKYINLMI